MFHIPEHLISKYGVIGPRYTSYPTAPLWQDIDLNTQKQWHQLACESQRPLSIYIHIPFCRERCYYCGCNVYVTKQQSQSAQYVSFLLKELESIQDLQNGNRKIRQLHFGGGTPNFLLNEEFELIFDKIKAIFPFEDNAEIAIEVNPGTITTDQLDYMGKLGINRLSLGVQDFNPKVQKAINRIQTPEITQKVLDHARQIGFKGINFDLIYGLPFQTAESFEKTINRVIQMNPDRLAIYNFGYLPERMPHQRNIDPDTLPNEKTKLSIFLNTIQSLTENGYNYIGMDHFAKPDDELSIAQKNRTLYRNFMGYTAKSGVDLVGIGVTSISEHDQFFLQNEKKLKAYKNLIDLSGFAGNRGIKLSRDDQIRKWTILRIICHFFVSFDEFEKAFNVPFKEYFVKELKDLEDLKTDGLLNIFDTHIEVIDHGKILVRNICMVFDAYLKKENVPKIRYSKTI